MTTTAAIIPHEVKTSVEEQNYPFKPNCGPRLPIYSNLSDSAQQFEQNMVWEPLGAEKSFDLNNYISYARFSNFSCEPSYFTVSSRQYNTNPLANSRYYDHLVNGGGSFNGGSGTKLNGCTTNIENESLAPQKQGQIYNIMPKLPPSSSAWSSFEDLNTPTTATTNSTATSRCSTPANNSGLSFNEQIKLEPFVAQQHKDVLNPTPLKSRPPFQDLTTIKKRISVTDLSPSLRGNGVQAFDNKGCSNNGAVNANNNQQHTKIRRSSNTTIMSNATVMSDTTSEQSDKSTAIESEKEQKKATLYKTEMCRNWEERGSCRYGSKCQFAHSTNELRIVQHHPKYKTEICNTFWQNGTCPYGKRCCFIHNDQERLLLCKRRNSADNLKNSSKKEKSKGLSKFGSDSALYGSYLSDSSNSSNGAQIPSTPSMSPSETTPSSSSNDDSLRAFADAYFSPSHNTSMPSETIDSNKSSPSTIRDDDITASSNPSPIKTPSKKRNTNFPCTGVLGFRNQLNDENDEISAFVDDPLMSSAFLNDAMDDGAKSLVNFGAFPNDLFSRVEKNSRSQERRRASSKALCKLETSINSINSVSKINGDLALKERN
ncbi:14421_t:CDS:2, partial [Funneliformis geosporum]